MTRAVIWAGVSSRPQVEDKDSLPRQIAEGEALCDRQGWQIVARLQVPGATRNYVDLADAIEGLGDDLRRLRLDTPNAYRELAELIAKRQRAYGLLAIYRQLNGNGTGVNAAGE